MADGFLVPLKVEIYSIRALLEGFYGFSAGVWN